MNITYEFAGFDKVFLDTCSLMVPAFDRMIGKFGNEAKRNPFIVTKGTVHELERLGRGDYATARSASVALGRLRQGLRNRTIVLFDNELRPDDFFLSYAAARRSDERLCFVTQDTALSRSLTALSTDGVAKQAYRLVVKRITFDGGFADPRESEFVVRTKHHAKQPYEYDKKPSASGQNHVSKPIPKRPVQYGNAGEILKTMISGG